MSAGVSNTYKQIQQIQLKICNDAMQPIGFSLQRASQVQLDPHKLYDMLQLDKKLSAQLDQQLAQQDSDASAKAVAADHLFHGALCMRTVRDFNIAALRPRERLLAGYRGLFAHAQSLLAQITYLDTLEGQEGRG